MLIQTRAIVLHRTPYNDRHAIVHLYTEVYGRLGVLVSERASRGRRAHPTLVPLSEVELTGELKPRRSLVQLGEVKALASNHRIQAEPTKCSQGIFISELLYRILSMPHPDSELYHFVSASLRCLNDLDRGIPNFYLCFTYRLLEHLAVAPTIGREAMSDPALWFDLQQACFTYTPQMVQYALPPVEARHLCLLARMTYDNLSAFRYSRHERGAIIDRLLLYYRLHLPTFGPIKSLEVLRATARS